MKKVIFIFALISLVFYSQVNALWVNKTMAFGGLTRSYRVYQSSNYNAANPASLVIALHGLGDNMTNFSGIGLNYIADTANIICIFPQAVTDALMGSSAWNSGAGAYGYYPNSGVDDIGFINAIIDTAMAKYSINNKRIYICGFSMGGFMTERMALQSNFRIAAFASMSGTIGSGITTFNPGRKIPIAHFHGTADVTVNYSGNTYGMDADTLVRFWALKNGCNLTPTTYNYPKTGTDTITIERFEYSNGDPDSDVWFYKMTGCTHTVLFKPTSDINEIMEVWLFLRRHTLANAGVKEQTNASNIQVFPNPANDRITITGIPNNSYEKTILFVYNSQGQLILNKAITEEISDIDLSSLAKGIYMIKITNSNITTIKKIVKQ